METRNGDILMQQILKSNAQQYKINLKQYS